MPSFTGSPLVLTFTGGTGYFTPGRIAEAQPARLRVSGRVSGRIGPADGTPAAAVTIPTLDYLMGGEPLIKPDGSPSERLQFIWQQAMDRIVASFTAVDERDAFQQSLIDRLTAVERVSQATRDEVAEVRTTVDATTEATRETFAYTNPELAAYFESVRPV